MENKTKVFLSGAISSNRFYKWHFKLWERYFKLQNMIVLSPAYLPHGLEYEQYMRITSAMLKECDQIAMLPGYGNSRGAMIELKEAYALCKDVVLCYTLYGKMRHGKFNYWRNKGEQNK
jgi:hypothetical protein